MITLAKRILGSILLVPALGAGMLAGVAVFLGSAFVVSEPWVLGPAGVAASGLVSWALARRPVRWITAGPERRFGILAGLGTAILVACLALVFLFRPHRFPAPAQGGGAVAFADLDTGSRLAYRVVETTARERRGGVIFVHGGPGAEAVSSQAFLSALAPLGATGFDVCLYDQIGSGLSERLPDPSGYTVERHVADLEALMGHLGWRHPVLIGESWGAQLIGRYAATDPTGPAAVVFVSPGPLDPGAWEGRETGSIKDRLSPAEDRAFNAVLDARLVAAMVLLRINPLAAARFLPEADAYGAAILAALSPGAVCDPEVLAGLPGSALNLISAQMTMRSLKKTPAAGLAVLADTRFPVLVLRGECDYARPEVAAEYVDAFPTATFVPVAAAGHFLLHEKPGEFLTVVSAFLDVWFPPLDPDRSP